MKISDVMENTLLSKKAIRYYEERGLIETERSENGYKDYSAENVERLLAIKKLRDLGFSIEEIRDYFESDEKKSAVLTRKLNEVEINLSIHSKERDILESLNDGKPINSIDNVPVAARQEKPYMYIRNINKVFGIFNLIAFVAVMIFTFWIKVSDPTSPEFGFWYWMFFLVALIGISINEKRRSILKKQGVTVLERKPLEIIFRALLYILFYIFFSTMTIEFLFSITRHISENHYDTIAFSIIGFSMMLAICVLGVISSFFEEFDDFFTFLSRRGLSSEKK